MVETVEILDSMMGSNKTKVIEILKAWWVVLLPIKTVVDINN